MKAREVSAVLAGRWAALLYTLDRAAVSPWVLPCPVQYRTWETLEAVSRETVTRITRVVPAVSHENGVDSLW